MNKIFKCILILIIYSFAFSKLCTASKIRYNINKISINKDKTLIDKEVNISLDKEDKTAIDKEDKTAIDKEVNISLDKEDKTLIDKEVNISLDKEDNISLDKEDNISIKNNIKINSSSQNFDENLKIITNSSYKHSIGVNYLANGLQQDNEERKDGCLAGKNCYSYISYKRVKNGFGIDYGLLLKYKNFLIEPKLFYDNINFKSPMNYIDHQLISSDWCSDFFVKINDAFGSKLRLGYEINTNFSAFISSGIANIRNMTTMGPCVYKPYALKIIYNDERVSIKKQNQIVPFYGFGFALNLIKNISVIAEYNIYRMQINPAINNEFMRIKQIMSDTRFVPIVNYKVKLDIFKLGVNYYF